MSTRCKPLTTQHKARVSRGVTRALARQRKGRDRLDKGTIRRLRAEGYVDDALLPLMKIARDEAAEITDALGGADEVSPQERALIDGFANAGLIERAALARFMQSDDLDAAKVALNAVATRKATLKSLGLHRRAKEIDLHTYVETTQENR